MEKLFSESDRKRIEEAVAAAERRTAGEIVPFVVARSDRYEVAMWRGAALVSLVAAAAVLVVLQFYQGWGFTWLHTAWGPLFVVLVASVAGAALGAFVAPVQRLLAADVMAQRVHLRALEAFVEEEVFATRDRTGILLYLSILEHRIEVVGDTGINRLVNEDDWAEVVTRVRDGIRQGRPGEGLVQAIGLCGSLLERSGVALRPDDTNELPDALRFRKPS